MTPDDKERADAIHLKISKIAFEATLRFVYIERRGAAADTGHINSIHGFIRQFNTQNLNSVEAVQPRRRRRATRSRACSRRRASAAKKHYLYETLSPSCPEHHESILNIEELATMFHFPFAVVSTTELEKVESRKGQSAGIASDHRGIADTI